jgi:hypothetical protein
MQECGANLHSRKPAILPLQVNGCRSVGLFLKEGAHREACVRGAGPQMASPTKLTRRTYTPTRAGLRPLEATGSGCRSGATPSCIEPTPGSAPTPQGSCARPRGATIARMTVVHVAGLGVAEDCQPWRDPNGQRSRPNGPSRQIVHCVLSPDVLTGAQLRTERLASS